MGQLNVPAAMRLYTCAHLVERSWSEGEDALDRGKGGPPLWCTEHEFLCAPLTACPLPTSFHWKTWLSCRRARLVAKCDTLRALQTCGRT